MLNLIMSMCIEVLILFVGASKKNMIFIRRLFAFGFVMYGLALACTGVPAPPRLTGMMNAKRREA